MLSYYNQDFSLFSHMNLDKVIYMYIHLYLYIYIYIYITIMYHLYTFSNALGCEFLGQEIYTHLQQPDILLLLYFLCYL